LELAAADGAAGLDGVRSNINWQLYVVNNTKPMGPITKTFLSSVFIEIATV